MSEYEFCAETVALLADHGVFCIQGNHEAVLFGGRNPDYLEKCRRTYPAESLAFLAAAPPRREFDFGGVRVLMTHTGLGEDEYIYPGSRRLEAFARMPYDMVCFGPYACAFAASCWECHRRQPRLLLAAPSAGPHRHLRHLRYRNAGSVDPPACGMTCHRAPRRSSSAARVATAFDSVIP